MSMAGLLKSASDGNSNIQIVWRNRLTSPVKLGSVLADTRCHPGDVVVNSETGFYVVAPTNTVISVSQSQAEGRLIELFFKTMICTM